jgi:GNAT superfamily N-acetyltransferase
MTRLAALRLERHHAADYRALMLEAYAAAPDAFTATVAERQGFPVSWWEKRLGEGNPDSVVFGAFVAGELAGAVGLARETRPKTRHKADVFGMYVVPRHRKLGLGAAMMEAVLAHARGWDGVRMLLLTVSEGNPAAQGLYERVGFVAFGIEPYAIREGERFIGKVHMALDLARTKELA